MVEAPLCALGAACRTRGGFPPIRVRGPIRGGAVEVDGRPGSQLLTGLLIALPLCAEDSIVSCPALASKPYVALTLELLGRFGVRVDADAGMERFRVPGGQRPAPTALRIEGDWSGAAFPLVAGAIAGAAEVTGLDPGSRQADRAVLEALAAAGARCRVTPEAVRVERGELRAFEFDAGHCPDLLPPLAALAAHCAGESVLGGAARLVGKESDRRAALVEELGGLGLAIRADGDVMRIRGGALRGGRVDARGDHRIAMAAAVAALGAAAPVEIEGDGCVAKSYPRFFEDLGRMGAVAS
jgi:3-phosphoshikimate 1-carboxyvinyltransferase